MTVGDIIDVLEQFPNGQGLNWGTVLPEDPAAILIQEVADVIVSPKHLVLVGSETSHLVYDTIGTKLSLRKSKREEPSAKEIPAKSGEKKDKRDPLLDMLLQFPRDQRIEWGIIRPEEPDVLVCLSLDHILVEGGEVILVDEADYGAIQKFKSPDATLVETAVAEPIMVTGTASP